LAILEKDKSFVLVVLGKNWVEYPSKNPPAGWKLELSRDSKVTALAAGVLAEKYHGIKKIIFVTGHTAGKDWPTGAEEMHKYASDYFPVLRGNKVLCETESIDTAQGAEKVRTILAERNLLDEVVVLLTVGYHCKRALKIHKNFGFKNIIYYKSESVLAESFNSANAKRVCWKALKDYRNYSLLRKFKKWLEEVILRLVLIFDPYGRKLRGVTNIICHQKEVK